MKEFILIALWDLNLHNLKTVAWHRDYLPMSDVCLNMIYCLLIIQRDCHVRETKKIKEIVHLKLLVRHAPRAATATTGAVSAVLVVILLRVVLGAGEAPPTGGSGQ